MCAVMLDTKVGTFSCDGYAWLVAADADTSQLLQGPEIRTGFLENDQPVKLVAGREITITTDYNVKANEKLIAMRCGCPLSEVASNVGF